MTIYFSHGKDSRPTGHKINYLKLISEKMQIRTESIDYTSTKNPDERVDILLNSYDHTDKNIVLYGSSMGAYVAIAASKTIKPKGLFLCAPALYLSGYKTNIFSDLNFPVTIVHGYHDKVVPYINSVKFAENNPCELHIVNDNHGLTKSQSLISFLFEEFLKKISSNLF